ncbi:hypothetical protein DW970_12830 [Clostridium sp. AM48-13]|uniref:hypothetical protein n=1 Tax=unclassified Clostridium TaxID=2614128 RepID=UPI000E4E49AB|nr:hypothetical protein DW023_10355 [Clostridium sp. AF37-7]RHQ16059.1 hypothetical protein DW970_12830 [Clostridium sp. AM48-13]
MPDAGSDENVAAFANRTNDDAVLEKTDSEENGEKEDTEGKDTEGKDAGENSKDKSEGGEGLEKAESGSGEQGDSGKDGNRRKMGTLRMKMQIRGTVNPMRKTIPVRQIPVLRVEMQI